MPVSSPLSFLGPLPCDNPPSRFEFFVLRTPRAPANRGVAEAYRWPSRREGVPTRLLSIGSTPECLRSMQRPQFPKTPVRLFWGQTCRRGVTFSRVSLRRTRAGRLFEECLKAVVQQLA
jgi:hypothetical protein